MKILGYLLMAMCAFGILATGMNLVIGIYNLFHGIEYTGYLALGLVFLFINGFIGAIGFAVSQEY